MLLMAAILLGLVGFMHSVLGGRRLIAPILKMDGLPVILGSLKNTRLTLVAGWHMLTLVWWGIAAVLAYQHFHPPAIDVAFLWMVSAVFAISGATALILSRGAHLSWLFFLPVAVLTGYVAYTV